jgi:hypothetical protein
MIFTSEVGKTFIASLLAQFYREKEAPVVCRDTEPVNSSSSAMRALEAKHISLLVGDRINVDALDQLVEHVMTQDAHLVIDNGAASVDLFSEHPYWACCAWRQFTKTVPRLSRISEEARG